MQLRTQAEILQQQRTWLQNVGFPWPTDFHHVLRNQVSQGSEDGGTATGSPGLNYFDSCLIESPSAIGIYDKLQDDLFDFSKLLDRADVLSNVGRPLSCSRRPTLLRLKGSAPRWQRYIWGRGLWLLIKLCQVELISENRFKIWWKPSHCETPYYVAIAFLELIQ